MHRALPTTARRYWLLRFDNNELKFTLRTAAERWASSLAELDTPSQLTWHDENTGEARQGRLQCGPCV